MDSKENIILITIDALRVDYLGCYGHSNDISPNIDRLASEGILFEHAFSTAPYTSASFKSIFTSRYPFSGGSSGTLWGFETLPTKLKARGYTTLAFLDTPVLLRRYGYGRGFDFFVNLADERLSRRNSMNRFRRYMSSIINGMKLGRLLPKQGRIRDVTAEIHDFLLGTEKMPYSQCLALNEMAADHLKKVNRSFFLWLHYMDTHRPYKPPQPFLEGLGTREVNRINRRLDQHLGVDTGAERVLLEDIKRLYRGAVRFVDYAVGHLYNTLGTLGLSENSVIIITSDHGEEFGEHGGLGHGGTAGCDHIYNELLRVPLLVHKPGLHGTRNSSPTSLLDLYAIIERYIDNGSLVFDGREWIISESLIHTKGQTPRHGMSTSDPKLVSLQNQKWKYIFNEQGDDELYDVEIDPQEKVNLRNECPGIAEELRARVMEHIREVHQPHPGKLMVKSRIEMLKSQGRL